MNLFKTHSKLDGVFLEYKKMAAEDRKFAERQEAKEDKKAANCMNWFGYLGVRERGEEIPTECIECQKSIECMLNQQY